jgi:hypothetical protein
MSASTRPGVQVAKCTQTWLADWFYTLGVGHLAIWSKEVSSYLRSNQMAKLDTWLGRVDQIANCVEAINQARWPAVQVANLTCAGTSHLFLLTRTHSRAHCNRRWTGQACSADGIRLNAGDSSEVMCDVNRRVILSASSWAGPR